MTAIAHRAKDSAATPPVVFDLAPASPLATLSDDLLPDEILVKRRLGYLKRRLVFVMIALIALLALGDMLVRQQTSSARDGLTGANDHIAALNKQLNHFNGILSVQAETQTIWMQLDGAMTDDVAWTSLLNRLADQAPAGVHIASVVATVKAGSADTTNGSATGPAVANEIGSLTMIGAAPSWKAVATYVNRLSAVKGFAAVNPSAVAHNSSGSGLAFTVTLDLTSGVLSSKYVVNSPTSSTSADTTVATGPTDSHTAAMLKQTHGSTGHATTSKGVNRHKTSHMQASQTNAGAHAGTRTTQESS